MSEQPEFFVEASIVTFIFDKENSELRAVVSCVFGEQKKRVIVARGLDDFLIGDLRACNIIDRVTLFAPGDAVDEPNECASALIYLMQKRDLSTSDFAWPAFIDKLNLIRSGKLKLMTVEPVAGASAVVLASDIAFE